MSSGVTLSLFGLALLVFACGPKSGGDSGSEETNSSGSGMTTTTGSSSTDAGTSSSHGDGDGDGDSDGDDCSPGNIECDGKCINPLTNDEHCGECGNACRSLQGVDGGCVDGRCAPMFGDCFEKGQFQTCDEACAAQGENCAPGGPEACGGQTWRVYADLDACMNLTGLDGYSQRPCDEAIAYQMEDFTEGTAARCCCQPPG